MEMLAVGRPLDGPDCHSMVVRICGDTASVALHKSLGFQQGSACEAGETEREVIISALQRPKINDHFSFRERDRDGLARCRAAVRASEADFRDVPFSIGASQNALPSQPDLLGLAHRRRCMRQVSRSLTGMDQGRKGAVASKMPVKFLCTPSKTS